MANCQKDTKYKYFSMLSYDISIYICVIARKLDVVRGVANSSHVVPLHIPAIHVTVRTKIRASTICSGRWSRLLILFMEPESVKSNSANRWRVRPFNEIAANEPVPSDVDNEDRTDCILHNMDARVSFDMLIWFVSDAGQTISMI